MQKAQQAYLQTQITTTSQGELVVMLYDGAIKFLQQAKEKMAEKNYAQKGILISKSLDIIAELDSSLNIEKGGELSNNLHSLYLYSQGRLLQANLKMDQNIVDEVLRILTSLRGAFAEIVNTPEALKAQKQAPEQAPVNVNSFRKQMPFGLDNGAESTKTSQPGPVMANNSVRAKAYNQQSSAFSSPQQAQATSATAPATTSVAETQVVEQALKTNAGESANVQQANLQSQVVQEAKKTNLVSANPAPANAAGPATAQTLAQTPASAQTTAFSPAQGAGASAFGGFGRQMINNSLYKKMAMTPTASAAPLLEE